MQCFSDYDNDNDNEDRNPWFNLISDPSCREH